MSLTWSLIGVGLVTTAKVDSTRTLVPDPESVRPSASYFLPFLCLFFFFSSRRIQYVTHLVAFFPKKCLTHLVADGVGLSALAMSAVMAKLRGMLANSSPARIFWRATILKSPATSLHRQHEVEPSMARWAFTSVPRS